MARPVSSEIRTYASTLNRIGWALVIFLVSFLPCSIASITIPILAEGLWGSFWADIVESIVSPIAYMLPFFAAGILYLVFSRKYTTERISFDIKLPTVFPLLILAGLAVITVSAYINSFFCDLISYEMPNDLFGTVYDQPYAVILYMSMALAPAFAEEFLFRGVIFTQLRPFGRWQAILISAGLFALMHQNIGQIIYTFAAGIVLALMYELTDSIWCGVICHLINNEIAVATEVLYYGRFGESMEPFLIAWDIAVCVLGIGALVFLIFHYRKKIKRMQASDGMLGQNVFGSLHELPAYGKRDREALPAKALVKGLLSPGMLLFVILTVLSMGLTYLTVMLGLLGGAV